MQRATSSGVEVNPSRQRSELGARVRARATRRGADGRLHHLPRLELRARQVDVTGLVGGVREVGGAGDELAAAMWAVLTAGCVRHAPHLPIPASSDSSNPAAFRGGSVGLARV